MAKGLDSLIKKASKNIDKTKIDMPAGFSPVVDTEAKYYKGALKAYCILAQKDAQGSWHSVKSFVKPAVDGLLFAYGEKIYMIDTRKTWIYDNGRAIIIYDIKQMMPVNARVEKRQITKIGPDGQPQTMDDPKDAGITVAVATPIEPLEPTALENPDVNIDSGWIFTVVIKKMIEQLTRASTPEQQTFNMFTIMMILLGVAAGISIGMMLAPSIFHLVPATGNNTVTTTATATQGPITSTSSYGFGSSTTTITP